MTDHPRLIEVAFPLKQASLDSVHEKNVRYGHISTLHIWPARRPLAACRAALIATLLPDPGDDEKRKELLEKLAGKIKPKSQKKKMPSGKVENIESEETEGGILHWGREVSPDLDFFREEIRKAYNGKAPKVLDPFAGGGAIPLEAMRMGCEATAIDINPVAWFILKCTLEYPQKLAGQKRPLPEFAKEKGQKKQEKQGQMFGEEQEGDLADHVRAWGSWVLEKARRDLAKFYPVVDNKPTVAYLWARTVKCKNCRALVPLLKTRWLCKKDKKRVLLTMAPNADKTGVVFGVDVDVAMVGSNGAQKREHDKRIGAGTMSRSGAQCPCCQAIMTMEDIRLEGQAGRLGSVMTAVVVDGPKGKEYRLPTEDEIRMAGEAESEIAKVFAEIPFGLPTEPLPAKEALGFRVPLYGFDLWHKIFTPRQLLALGTFVKYTRMVREEMAKAVYPPEWIEAVSGYLAVAIDRLADYCSALCRWVNSRETLANTFTRFALPIIWDFCEVNCLSETTGGYFGAIEWIRLYITHVLEFVQKSPFPQTSCNSAIQINKNSYETICTDPPYYDSVPYSDLMDFFYLWLRRNLYGLSPELAQVFQAPLSPKWNHDKQDGELIDDASRFDNDRTKSKANYEDGMYRVFENSYKSLAPEGRFVVVFAHKHPDAWETLVSAMIRAGFIVTASWPIQTERIARTRALSSAALASSIWLVCKKRPQSVRPGWDNKVLEEMREKIILRLRQFWDEGLRGPDFVWSATGPALEAYSKYPVVKKANEPGQIMSVSEFLRHVRRMVVDFVVGRVLSSEGNEAIVSLDDVTTYYLLHRHDFGVQDVPSGVCILYAISCGLSDRGLADQYDILARTGGKEAEEAEESEEESAEITEGTGSKVRLKNWLQRKRKSMGYENNAGTPIPLIDQVHRLMHLWKEGDVVKVDEYLEQRGLRRLAIFPKFLQSLIELSENSSEERSLLESISNHVVARGRESKHKQDNWIEKVEK